MTLLRGVSCTCRSPSPRCNNSSTLDSCILKNIACLLEKVLKLPDCAKRPLEALAGVPQVAHDEAVLPAALHRPWTPEVGRRGRPVMHSPKSGQIGKGMRKRKTW